MNHTEWNPEANARLVQYLNRDGYVIPAVLGTEDSACSIAAINLALTGELTSNIPACMSPVICRWIIAFQDAMPTELRNSPAWRELLPLAADTGRAQTLEDERLALILRWAWEKAFPAVQPLADADGFGDPWQTMCFEQTEEAALAACLAAREVEDAMTIRYEYHGTMPREAMFAKSASWAAWSSAALARHTSGNSGNFDFQAICNALAGMYCTDTFDKAVADGVCSWDNIDPIGLLSQLAATR